MKEWFSESLKNDLKVIINEGFAATTIQASDSEDMLKFIYTNLSDIGPEPKRKYRWW